MNKRIKKKHKKKAMQLLTQLCATIADIENTRKYDYKHILDECRTNYIEHLKSMLTDGLKSSAYSLEDIQLIYNEAENTVDGTITLMKPPTEFEIILKNK